MKAQTELKWLNRAPAAFGGVTWEFLGQKECCKKERRSPLLRKTPRVCKHGRSRIGLTARLNGQGMPQSSLKKAAADLH